MDTLSGTKGSIAAPGYEHLLDGGHHVYRAPFWFTFALPFLGGSGRGQTPFCQCAAGQATRERFAIRYKKPRFRCRPRDGATVMPRDAAASRLRCSVLPGEGAIGLAGS